MRIVLAATVLALLAAVPARAESCGYRVTLAFGKGCSLQAGSFLCVERSALTGACEAEQSCTDATGCKYTLAPKQGPSPECPAGSRPAQGLRCSGAPGVTPTAGAVSPPRADRLQVEVELSALCVNQNGTRQSAKALAGTCTLTNKGESPNAIPDVTLTAAFSGEGCSGGKSQTSTATQPGDAATITAVGMRRGGACSFECAARSSSAQTLGQSPSTDRLATAAIACPP
jgi:hypothetical protein